MKLNLLPVSVTKRSSAPVFIVLSILMVALSAVASYLMITSSQKRLQDAIAERDGYLPGYANNMFTAKSAEQVVLKAAEFDRNTKLAEAMGKHNGVYPDLYSSLIPFIPSFYRIVSMTATAQGEQTSVTLVGQIQTFQQYADVDLALWRIPGVLSVQRAGYVPSLAAVQPLSADVQRNVKLKPGDPSLPDDPLDRIEVLKQKAASSPVGYQNVGNFGTEAVPKGPMPGWSTVTMAILLNKNIQTPDPAATLQQGAVPADEAPVGTPAAAPAAAAPAKVGGGT